VARDHLSNERTYLGWLRTSISLSSIGIAVTQLFRISAAGIDPDVRRRRRAVEAGLTIMGQSRDLTALFAESSSADPFIVALYEQQRLQASQLDELLNIASAYDQRRN